MAIYLSIVKVGEDATSAEYSFSRAEGAGGRVRIDKATGTVTLVAPLPGDEDGLMYGRTAYKLHKLWSQGPLPERTSWAS